MSNEPDTIQLSSAKFLVLCVILAGLLLDIGQFVHYPAWFIAAEIFSAILALFIFGSIRWRIDKNALTYGAGLVIAATFFTAWWPASALKDAIQKEGFPACAAFAGKNFFSLHSLEQLIHADTMLFILGLTFFVAIIAQTRLLETISFIILEKTKGALLPTIGLITGLVALASGILDGVSMIGLMIRTLVIILFLAKAREESVLFAVVISTVVTTVCGMWLAYGEPPNLIMKANLQPLLNDAFFLKYCLPAAAGSFVVVFLNLRRHLKKSRVQVQTLDILERHTADVKFIQAAKHGKVLIAGEFIEEIGESLGVFYEPLLKRIHAGESLGEAMVRAEVPEVQRKIMLDHFISRDLVGVLDEHFVAMATGRSRDLAETTGKISDAFKKTRNRRVLAQIAGGVSFIPFVALLILHGRNHAIPLFVAPWAGYVIALAGVFNIPKMRWLALREAALEYSEYLFLLPLFFSISLLQKTGFFGQIAAILENGIRNCGLAHVAAAQYAGATFLSAMLDNNVVADLGSRALKGLEVGAVYLFSMAQIAGYAAGGCWTHIGSAQSVVAYSFIRKQVNRRFTPFQWIKLMTPIVLEISAFLLLWVYLIGWLHVIR